MQIIFDKENTNLEKLDQKYSQYQQSYDELKAEYTEDIEYFSPYTKFEKWDGYDNTKKVPTENYYKAIAWIAKLKDTFYLQTNQQLEYPSLLAYCLLSYHNENCWIHVDFNFDTDPIQIFGFVNKQLLNKQKIYYPFNITFDDVIPTELIEYIQQYSNEELKNKKE